MKGQRVVAGIDPGSQRVGWAIAAVDARGGLLRLDSGIWALGRSPQPMAERLTLLHAHLDALLAEWRPAEVALEAAFFGRNARSALRLGEARGAILVACGAHGIGVRELPPATVKRRVAGAGAAAKESVAELVRMHYGLEDHDFAGEDESDALAVAACLLLEGAEVAVPAVPGPARGAAGRTLPPGASFQ